MDFYRAAGWRAGRVQSGLLWQHAVGRSHGFTPDGGALADGDGYESRAVPRFDGQAAAVVWPAAGHADA